MPPEGVAIRDRFPAAALEGMMTRLLSVAGSMGVSLNQPERIPNSRKALALVEFARQHNRLESWREVAMRAHWQEGRDIGNSETLADMLTEVGLDAAAGLEFCESTEASRTLEMDRGEAARWGVSQVPTWLVLPDGWSPEIAWPSDGPQPARVVGCQTPEILGHAIERAGGRART